MGRPRGGGGLPFLPPIFAKSAGKNGPFLHGKMLNFDPLRGKMHFDPPPFPRGKLTIFDTLKNEFADLPRDLHCWGGATPYFLWATHHGFFIDV